ncbi:MAG: hypothetical protein NZ108_05120, partial [Bacteroidia bacterium]|nr:hypothetical protein [Bacteroidia bacterium]
MNKKVAISISLLCTLASGAFAQSNPNNNQIDGLDEMSERREIMMPMSDGTRLATDVFLPILQDNLSFPINTTVSGITISGNVTIAKKGLQYLQYPNQPDPFKMPVIFTRTPYNKRDPLQGQAIALLGYCGIIQDMRGRYRSEGVYLPMYSDSWAKRPYFNDPNFGHPLDTTYNKSANDHQDGHESLLYILNQLRRDRDGDTIEDSLVCNGKIGMFGASALGNTQYQAGAVQQWDYDSIPGLKCLMPIVASAEFYHSTGHQNGVFRERIIDGWLRGQVERYDWQNVPDGSIFNNIHTLGDYGPNITDSLKAAETAIDFWTTMNGAHYPNSFVRPVMDMSRARIDAQGNPDRNGTHSRYKFFEIPIMNITGWWDIFTDGQIDTWQRLTKHLSPRNKHRQKIVIGPWAHQTIASTKTGDVTYRDNVSEVGGINIDNFSVNNIGDVGNSELILWFRSFLGGDPMFVLPPNPDWQSVNTSFGTINVRIPADTLKMTFTEFFNFINGAGPLTGLKVEAQGLGQFTLPPITLPTSLIGDTSRTPMSPPGSVEFDASKPNGIKNVRFYVVGPNDSTSTVGNYWMHTDTFPIPNVSRQKLYFHAGNRSLNSRPPFASESGFLSYISDPDNPVRTHGGNNMIVYTPDGERLSQGQMNLADPRYAALTMNRVDVLQFTSAAVTDSFCVIGYPVATLYAKTKPTNPNVPFADSSNTDFIVRVVDVCPDGRELFVTEGCVNARGRLYAKSYAEDNVDDNAPFMNIKSDSLYEYKFKMLPLAYTFGPGHKIKILISSTNWP